MPTATYSVQPQSRWSFDARDHDTERILRAELGISSLTASALVQRGFRDLASAARFLNPMLADLHDPKLLPDYADAVNAILGAKERQELIFVHGDYDVDGVTSAAIFDRFLASIGANVKTHVPHRMKEGYGIHLSAVAAAKAAGAKLFLTCDCGVSAHEQVKAAHEAGMVVVVTDHHSIGHKIPDAAAVVNPHREDSEYPFDELSGAGVAFKLSMGLAQELGHSADNFARAFLDLAALGTIADIVPLVDENRIIAKFGLERLGATKKVGLRALFDQARIGQDGAPITARQVGFQIGPRLNAAGRIDDAARALQLLIERDEVQAATIAGEIEEINLARRTEQQRVTEQAQEIIEREHLADKNVIVVGGRDWHPGVIGIVASRIVELYKRPTFVAAFNDATGTWKSSARSIPGFNLANAIREHPDLFLGGGGHAAAAGCEFEGDRIEAVSEALHLYAATKLGAVDYIPTIVAVAEIDFAELTMRAVDDLTRLEPFGQSNPEPIFVGRRVRLAQVTPTKNPEHVRLLLRDPGGTTQTAMAFGMGTRFAAVGVGSVLDVVFQAQVDEWNGNRSVKLILRDFAVHEDL